MPGEDVEVEVGRAATHTRASGAVRTQPSLGTTMLWVHKPRTCRPSDPTIVGMTTMLGTTADGDEGVLRVATVRLPPAATAGVNRLLLSFLKTKDASHTHNQPGSKLPVGSSSRSAPHASNHSVSSARSTAPNVASVAATKTSLAAGKGKRKL
jgi:hypothetical protein